MYNTTERPFLQSIQIRNLLSFGPETPDLDLQPLNVLIGPNGSGKSNLIDALGILQTSPKDILASFKGKASGGIAEWLWKGGQASATGERSPASIDVQICIPKRKNAIPLRHRLSFGVAGQKFELIDEVVEDSRPERLNCKDVRFYYRFRNGNPVLNVKSNVRALRREHISFDQSILSQRRDPDQYPEIFEIIKHYEGIKLYREWHLGRNAPPRQPYPTDMPGDHLAEDASNLVLVLNAMEMESQTRELLLLKLKEFNSRYTHISQSVIAGSIQLYLEENLSEDSTRSVLIPASRLSDGTMRFLCLLAVLCHPRPPPLVCIEEPEMGLHPDILPTVVELLREASNRTQLIVTTHSDIIVDALTETPEAVVVCEKVNGQTQMRRLGQDDLKGWIENYRLGGAWLNGAFGGTRW
ncbi:MAG: AAA family ATPase [Magnetococcales bacterium]|nr:AAA family ATPase [Magnetococcales bacterium]